MFSPQSSALGWGGSGGTLRRHGAVAHLARTRHGGRLGGCSAADIERFAKEEGEDTMELAARLLAGVITKEVAGQEIHAFSQSIAVTLPKVETPFSSASISCATALQLPRSFQPAEKGTTVRLSARSITA